MVIEWGELRMKKFFVLLVALSILFAGCEYKAWFGKRPCDQPNSKWESEDQSIYFEMDEYGLGTGYLLSNGEKVEFLIQYVHARIEIYASEAIDRMGVYSKETYEIWWGSFDQADSFTATVKQTTFFSVGQELKFYRIDDPES